MVRVLDRLWKGRGWPRRTTYSCATPSPAGGDLGFSELTIAALLKHSARGVTQRYIHIDRR